MMAYLRPWLGWLRAWPGVRNDHAFEVAAPKQQLAMYEGCRRSIRDSDRLFWVVLVRVFPRWRDSLVVVRPETVVRWHRAGWRRYWTWKSRPRHGGRPLWGAISPSRGSLVLMSQSPEHPPTDHGTCLRRRHEPWLRDFELERAVWSRGVVVPDELAQHMA